MAPEFLGAATAAVCKPDPRLLIGFENADDAGVVALDPTRALVQTVDFFTPVVDDPRTFGRIAATNALSDVYAMGGTPLSALNIVCFPSRDLPSEVLREILLGGSEVLDEAGALLVGGHTVRDKELKYGMAVTGLVHPDRIWANGSAQPGDVLVLTKPIGTGVLTTALKRDLITEADLQPAVDAMATLNRVAAEVGQGFTVHACTDITGNGLAGHGWEMARGSGVTLHYDFDSIPLFPGALDAAKADCVPGGARATQRWLGDHLITHGLLDHQVDLLIDPQTSGGLLFAVPASEERALRQALADRGVSSATVGRIEAGPAGVVVR